MSAILTQIEKIEQVSYQIRRERREIERRAMTSRYYDLIMSLRNMTQEAEGWLSDHFAIRPSITVASTERKSGEGGRSMSDRSSESPPLNPQPDGSDPWVEGLRRYEAAMRFLESQKLNPPEVLPSRP